MQDTPKGMRLHIGIFGRRNTGKSSLLNSIIGQDVAIVSPTPGTTTDVVNKPFEMKPLGPLLFLDTAGLDDIGELGEKRTAKSRAVLDRTELAFIVTCGQWDRYEQALAQELKKRGIPSIAVFNKSDLGEPDAKARAQADVMASEVVRISALKRTGLEHLREALVRCVPREFMDQQSILADLVGPGDMVVLVVPIDLEAPKGRLILPQVQVIREILDSDARAVVVKERELPDTLENFKTQPQLVITDSQAILKVAAQVPPHIPLTSFSILYARWKGDLDTLVHGASALDTLHPGDKILILEACSHHPIADDIGRVKIPRWLKQYSGNDLFFNYLSGHDLPSDFKEYNLIILCGSCVTNRREVLTRILRAREAGIPVTNYGLVIAKSLGVLERCLSPFPGLGKEQESG